jgi:manganese oxidase
MRPVIVLASTAMLLAAPGPHRAAPAAVAANENRVPAGVLRDGVLTVRLEAREGEWHPDRDADPGLVVRAFAEAGKPALVPGPLLRVPEGTEIRATVHNTLARDTLVVRGLSTRGLSARGAAAGEDTLRVPPGATRAVRFLAGAPGTYHYSGTTGATLADRSTRDAVLSGAFVVDPRGAPRDPRDRVLVLSLWNRDARPNLTIDRADVLRFAINGKAWPNTERLSYDVGDTVRFRVVNASSAVHPMHLHGFYFRVDGRGDGAVDSAHAPGAPPQLVVTERLAPGRTMAMSWVPERPGNWLFHCHDNYHVLRNAPLDGTALAAEHTAHTANHALEMMGGLVLGIEVRGRDPVATLAANASEPARRRLRLVAAPDTGGTEAEPAYGYALQEPGAGAASPVAPRMPGPTIVLKRGEPVSITVVNALREPTAVHWHGIELESYYDGVAGYSGRGRRISPVIAPRDSFEARFTPPRAGTFIYHPHADEVRQQQAGLSGAIVVVDSPAAYDPAADVVLLLTVPRRDADRARILINGSATPPALELRAGQRYRLRLVDIHTYRPSMIARLLRDSVPVTWRALAKDGMELPPGRATVRPAVQQMGNGETYDFEVAPAAPGDLRLVVTSAAGVPLATMPVRVR